MEKHLGQVRKQELRENMDKPFIVVFLERSGQGRGHRLTRFGIGLLKYFRGLLVL